MSKMIFVGVCFYTMSAFSIFAQPSNNYLKVLEDGYKNGQSIEVLDSFLNQVYRDSKPINVEEINDTLKAIYGVYDAYIEEFYLPRTADRKYSNHKYFIPQTNIHYRICEDFEIDDKKVIFEKVAVPKINDKQWPLKFRRKTLSLEQIKNYKLLEYWGFKSNYLYKYCPSLGTYEDIPTIKDFRPDIQYAFKDYKIIYPTNSERGRALLEFIGKRTFISVGEKIHLQDEDLKRKISFVEGLARAQNDYEVGLDTYITMISFNKALDKAFIALPVLLHCANGYVPIVFIKKEDKWEVYNKDRIRADFD